METFRCPACLFVLADPEQSRCPSCHKRLRRRGRPIVLGDKTKFGANDPLDIDLVYAERVEREKARNKAAERVAAPVDAPRSDASLPMSPPWVSPPTADAPSAVTPPAGDAEAPPHTTIFAPSQLNPEMRQVLDDLYRKARAEVDEIERHDELQEPSREDDERA